MSSIVMHCLLSAWFWGDPHFTTLDGAGYTFNGWGEYSLLEINTSEVQFLLQGRTNPVNNSKATQLVAFAMKASPNSPVEVYVICNMYKCYLPSILYRYDWI